jgi:peptidoglycan/xylan/chitin deacetylase (PgdA/CDA1 family)
MYHSIGTEDESGVAAYYRTVTSPQRFSQQMSYLRDKGYSSISLPELRHRLVQRRELNRCVAITFDDGYRDFYENAFPILDKFRIKATVFLPTAFISDSRLSFKSKKCMTWSEIRELSKLGVSFCSHTVTHPQLYHLTQRLIDVELTDSKEAIEQELGGRVGSFAYPFAFPEHDEGFKLRLRESLLQAGYDGGVCTTIGRVGSNEDKYFMRRLPINSSDDELLFEAKLTGAYDWVARPQCWVKRAKGWLQYG